MHDAIKKRTRRAEQIKARLALAGFRLCDIERQYRLKRGAAGMAMRIPHEAAEQAIAAVLGVAASELWPERYDRETGQRRSPQPPANYDRLPTIRQRRKTPINLTEAA